MYFVHFCQPLLFPLYSEDGPGKLKLLVQENNHIDMTHFYYFYFSDDGAVRVWRNYCDDEENKRLTLVTAWTALNGMIPSQRGMDKIINPWSVLGSNLIKIFSSTLTLFSHLK